MIATTAFDIVPHSGSNITTNAKESKAEVVIMFITTNIDLLREESQETIVRFEHKCAQKTTIKLYITKRHCNANLFTIG